MKITSLLSLLGVGVFAAPAFLGADDSPAPRVERRVEVIRGSTNATHPTLAVGDRLIDLHVRTGDDADEPTGPVTFLGIETTRVPAVLTEQLGLPKGIGLVVQRVVEGAPAAGVLKKHDVLTKLDDQLLISAEQLGVLVRSKAKGAKVTLTLVRAGKEQTVEVELGERQARTATRLEFRSGDGLAPMAPAPSGGGEGQEQAPGMPGVPSVAGTPKTLSRVEVDRLIGSLPASAGATHAERGFAWMGSGGASPVMRMLSVNQGNVVFSDDEGSVYLKVSEGDCRLQVKGTDGAVVFDGPVNTEEERAALAEPVKARLQKVENIKTLEFRTSEDFQVEEVRVLTPEAKSVWLTRPATGVAVGGGIEAAAVH